MSKTRSLLILVVLAGLLAASSGLSSAGSVGSSSTVGTNPAQVEGPEAPSLGGAESFAVLAYSTVTNTGDTVVTGNVGVSPLTSVTGFNPPGIVLEGEIHAADDLAAQARVGAQAAYDDLAGRPCDQDLTGQNLGGLTLTPGVYCFDTSADLTGTLVLDADGDANGVFIFKIGSTLITASSASVSLINGANQCNVFWQVGSSATLGSSTAFAGVIIADISISLNNGASVVGKLLALNGAVTLINNVVSMNCWTSQIPTPTATTEGPTATATETAVASATSTEGPTATATDGPTATATVEGPTATATEGPSATATETPMATTTEAPTATATNTPTATATSTQTATAVIVPTAASISTPVAAPVATPTTPAILGVPQTGGGGLQQNLSLPALMVSLLGVIIVLSGVTLLRKGRVR